MDTENAFIETISAPLRRPIKSGARYDRLFPKVSCKKTELGNGHNNTIEGVNFMADIIKEYAWQTKKIAQKLKGNDLEETLDNIYDFSYNHIQYLADGRLQRLRSPACTWHDRQIGIDCKSYTIFCMSILQNLGITAAIRQVKQPGEYADLFTHVYVVVPLDQSGKFEHQLNEIGKYQVVDPTKEQNNEVLFVEKKDKIMQIHQYVGMNAAILSKRKLNAKEIGKLELFSKKLTQLGFSDKKNSEIIAQIKTLITNGVPPKEINIFFKGGVLYVVSQENDIYTYRVPIPTGSTFIASKAGMNAGEAGTASAVSKALKKVPWKKLGKSVGGIFTDVFRGGHICIGSSYSPTKVRGMVNDDLPGLLDISGINGKNANLGNINHFFWLASGYWFRLIAVGNSLGSCSRDALKLGADTTLLYMKDVKNAIDEKLQEQGVVLKLDRMARSDEYDSIEICKISDNGGWNDHCGSSQYTNFIGKINPITGTKTTGGLGGRIWSGGQVGFGIGTDRYFASNFYKANKDFTFDGSFLNNIDVDKIFDEAVENKNKKLDKSSILATVDTMLKGKNSGGDASYSLSTKKPSTAGSLGFLFLGAALIPFAWQAYKGKTKGKKKKIAKTKKQ